VKIKLNRRHQFFQKSRKRAGESSLGDTLYGARVYFEPGHRLAHAHAPGRAALIRSASLSAMGASRLPSGACLRVHLSDEKGCGNCWIFRSCRRRSGCRSSASASRQSVARPAERYLWADEVCPLGGIA